jgi:signal peptidase I
MSAILMYPRTTSPAPESLASPSSSVTQSQWRIWLSGLLLGGLLPLVLALGTLSAYRVDGHSMDPHLSTGERLFVNTQSYDLSGPQRGDVIVFACPADRRQIFIKRVIGLPDDTIEMHSGQIFINGQALPDSYKVYAAHGDMAPHLILNNHYFVMGDNRDLSDDSRYWGDVSRQAVIGQAVACYWPLRHCQMLQ